MNYHTKEIPHFYHVSLNVSDLSKMQDFYTSMIGLKVLNQDKDKVVLGVKKNPLLTLNKVTSLKRNKGLYHFALLLSKRSYLADILQHLLNNNVNITGASDHVISEAIYLNDPEGNGIEIAVDRDKSYWPYKNNQLDILYRNGPLDIKSLLSEKNKQTFSSLSDDTLLGHVHLHVHDVKKTGQFFTKIFNIDTTIDIQPSAMFFSFNGYHHHLAINTWTNYNPEEENEENLGLRSLYFYCPNQHTFDTLKMKSDQQPSFVISDDDLLIIKDPANHQIIITQ